MRAGRVAMRHAPIVTIALLGLLAGGATPNPATSLATVAAPQALPSRPPPQTASSDDLFQIFGRWSVGPCGGIEIEFTPRMARLLARTPDNGTAVLSEFLADYRARSGTTMTIEWGDGAADPHPDTVWSVRKLDADHFRIDGMSDGGPKHLVGRIYQACRR